MQTSKYTYVFYVFNSHIFIDLVSLQEQNVSIMNIVHKIRLISVRDNIFEVGRIRSA